jgi:hypothetical protein
MRQKAPHAKRRAVPVVVGFTDQQGGLSFRSLPLLLLLVAGSPSLSAAHQAIVQPGAGPIPQAVERLQDVPALSARFAVSTTAEESRSADRSAWYLVREQHRIERVRPDSGTAEIWERDDRGDVTLKRVFRNEARVVEYASGDLRAM